MSCRGWDSHSERTACCVFSLFPSHRKMCAQRANATCKEARAVMIIKNRYAYFSRREKGMAHTIFLCIRLAFCSRDIISRSCNHCRHLRLFAANVASGSFLTAKQFFSSACRQRISFIVLWSTSAFNYCNVSLWRNAL